MKLPKILLLTFMALISSSVFCVEHQFKNDLEKAFLSGKVKQICKYKECPETNTKLLVYEAKYNSDGFLI